MGVDIHLSAEPARVSWLQRYWVAGCELGPECQGHLQRTDGWCSNWKGTTLAGNRAESDVSQRKRAMSTHFAKSRHMSAI